MESVSNLPPAIQYVFLRHSNAGSTFEEIGRSFGFSKQAIEQQYKKALGYLKKYPVAVESQKQLPCQECCKKDTLIDHLRQSLVLRAIECQSLRFFKEQVLKFFPKFKIARLPGMEKKKILDSLDKFKSCGGTIKIFAEAVGRSAETLANWQAAYEKHGMAGLIDKKSRPKNFGNKVPLWIKQNLLVLFLQYPNWSPYQYHSYIRHNPTTNWYLSLPVIQKLKNIHHEKSMAEKLRMGKGWCFPPGTEAWNVDFTCIKKTESYKLQLLTISDQRSRYLLHAQLYLDTSTESVVRDLEELFIKYGKPMIIKADNGPEFRLEFREQLQNLSVYLLNSPPYYGQFNGAHERIHRTLKAYITDFDLHQNLTRLVMEIQKFMEEYNYKIPMDSLGGKTPADIFLSDEPFTPKNAEIITSYQKEGELRFKFTNREGNLARMGIPLIPTEK
jgi:predicted DNA-binding protein YlxM (UPF0122 family)